MNDAGAQSEATAVANAMRGEPATETISFPITGDISADLIGLLNIFIEKRKRTYHSVELAVMGTLEFYAKRLLVMREEQLRYHREYETTPQSDAADAMVRVRAAWEREQARIKTGPMYSTGAGPLAPFSGTTIKSPDIFPPLE